MSTTMLYKKGSAAKLHGHMVDYITVADKEVDEHVKAGWSFTPAEAHEEKKSKPKSAKGKADGDE